MQVEPTSHPEVLLVRPDIFGDPRGFFMESFHARKYAAQGLPGQYVQDNHSRSTRGVLRGLHYQLNHPQGKLIRVVTGEVFDVAVDIRRGSPYFGQWTAVTLSEENRLQLYIPPGFAHGSIEHLAGHHPDQLALRVIKLVVQTAQDAARGA